MTLLYALGTFFASLESISNRGERYCGEREPAADALPTRSGASGMDRGVRK